MEIKILGAGCAKCKSLEKMTYETLFFSSLQSLLNNSKFLDIWLIKGAVKQNHLQD